MWPISHNDQILKDVLSSSSSGAGKQQPMGQVWPDARLCKYGIYRGIATPIPGAVCTVILAPQQQRRVTTESPQPQKPKMFIPGPFTAQDYQALLTLDSWETAYSESAFPEERCKHICLSESAYKAPGVHLWGIYLNSGGGHAPLCPSPTSTELLLQAECDCSFDKFQISGQDSTKHVTVTIP